MHSSEVHGNIVNNSDVYSWLVQFDVIQCAVLVLQCSVLESVGGSPVVLCRSGDIR